MKTLLISLITSQMAFASMFGLFGAVDIITAEKYCSKVAASDRAACKEMTKGKRYRSDFIDLCSTINKKSGCLMTPLECLEKIADKDRGNSSEEQAELCEAMIKSKNCDYITQCVEVKVEKEFAELCERYIDSGKNYGALNKCLKTLDGYSLHDLDLAHFRIGCKSIKDKDFSGAMVSCLINAEEKKAALTGGNSSIRERATNAGATK